MSTTPPIRPVEQQEISPHSKRRLLFVVVAVLIVLTIGGLFWLIDDPEPPPPEPTVTPTRPAWTENQEPETATAAAEIRGFTALSTSHNLGVIAADLESTRLNNLNAEFNAIEAVLAR